MRNHRKLPRKKVKIDEKMKNPYENKKKSVFFKIPYVNSAWCQNSVFVRINSYIWQHCDNENVYSSGRKHIFNVQVTHCTLDNRVYLRAGFMGAVAEIHALCPSRHTTHTGGV